MVSSDSHLLRFIPSCGLDQVTWLYKVEYGKINGMSLLIIALRGCWILYCSYFLSCPFVCKFWCRGKRHVERCYARMVFSSQPLRNWNSPSTSLWRYKSCHQLVNDLGRASSPIQALRWLKHKNYTLIIASEKNPQPQKIKITNSVVLSHRVLEYLLYTITKLYNQ